MGKQYDVTAACKKNLCPAAIQWYVTCRPDKDNNLVCTETIPGYLKMRSKFADFTGTYVLHCHILIHEDRGMMQMVEGRERSAVSASLRSECEQIVLGPTAGWAHRMQAGETHDHRHSDLQWR